MLGVIIPEGGVAKIFWSDTSLSDSASLQNFFVEAGILFSGSPRGR